MASKDPLATYDWDNDERWRAIRRGIEIPPNQNEKVVLLKRKRKFYKENVDTSYVIPNDFPKAPYKPKPKAKPTPGAAPTPSPSSSSRPTSNGTYGNGRAPDYGSSSANQIYRDTVVSGPLTVLPDMRGTIDMALYAIALLASIIYLIPFVSADYSYIAMSIALKTIAIASGLRVYYAFGLPKLSLDSVKVFFRNAFGSNDFFHLVFIIFCHMATPIFAFALWTGVCGASVTLAYVNARLGNHAMIAKLRQPPFNKALEMIPSRGEVVESALAWIEILVVAVSVVYIFTAARSLLFLFMVVNFIRMRYILSQAHREAFAKLNAGITARVASIPKAGEWYEWCAAKAYTFVDPDVLLAQAKAAQS